MTETNVLVVDDDAGVRTLLRHCLESDGYKVHEAATANDALELLDRVPIDLITLDLNLEGENGFEVAQLVRKTSDVPIIIVSAKGDVIDRVVGLEVGADDYISKPFHVREVLARVRSVLRRARGSTGSAGPVETPALREYAFAGFRAYPDKLELIDRDRQPVPLTGGDFRLLTVFLERPRRVLSREQIMDILSGPGWSPLDRTIDNQVARLRKKIETEPGDPKLIKTVRGVGYIFTPDVAVSAGSGDLP